MSHKHGFHMPNAQQLPESWVLCKNQVKNAPPSNFKVLQYDIKVFKPATQLFLNSPFHSAEFLSTKSLSSTHILVGNIQKKKNYLATCLGCINTIFLQHD